MRSPYKIIKAKNLELLKLEYQKLLESNTAATAFIKEIENGNLDASFTSDSDEEEGLTKALLAMQQQLQKIAEDEKERNWATQGLALFADILRADNDNSKVFYQKIISNLVKYLNVNQGGLFLVDDHDSSNISIELVSCYAYNRQKHITKQIKPGEGLIGQCYLEKETIFMTDIPQSYIEITSGLGVANPACLIIVPLKVNEQVHGFVELAGFKPLKPYQVDFLERLGESIASSISSVKINQRTRQLLEDTQQQAEEMKSQEEEMRQNMEELSATQEDMERIVREAQTSERYTKELMGASKDSIYVVNREFIITDFNPTFLIPFKKTGLQLEKGDSVFKFLAEDQWDNHRTHFNRAFKGESFDVQEFITTLKLHFLSSYSPLRNAEGEITAVVVFAKDITELVSAKEKAEELLKESQLQAEEMLAQEEEMRQSMEELSATQEEMERILQEVQGNEAFMNDLMNSTTDSILTIGKDYRIISCNQAMLESLKAAGMTAEKGTDVFTLVSDTQKQKTKEQYDRTFQGESLKVIENYSVGEHELYYEINHNPLRNEKAEIIGAAIFSKNITEEFIAKRESNKLLKEAQAGERYTKELMGASKDSIFVVNKEYIITDFNPTFLIPFKNVGLQVEKGDSIFKVLEESQRDNHKKLFDRALTGESFDVQEHISNLDLHFLSSYSPLRNAEGEITAVVVFAKNITELISAKEKTEELLKESQLQAEEMLAQEEEMRQNMEELSATQEEMNRVVEKVQQHEQHFSELLNGSDQPILAIDASYRLSSYNKAYAIQFGEFGKQLSKGSDLLSVFPPEIRAAKKKLFDRVLAGETIETTEPMEIEGKLVMLKAKHIPLRDRNGAIDGIGAYLQHVTEDVTRA